MGLTVTIDELCSKLGVGYALGPYQTHPWSASQADKGMTCSAEVRMGTSGDEIEAEAQMMYDVPPAGKPPMEQICYLKATPSREGKWDVVALRIKGEPYGKDIANWQEKSCNFFSMLVGALAGDEIPDIDALIEEAFHAKEKFYNQRQGGGGRAAKAKAGQLLGMKKGGGGF
jgi:hypothetical protein